VDCDTGEANGRLNDSFKGSDPPDESPWPSAAARARAVAAYASVLGLLRVLKERRKRRQ
jgi:hypothetical protein